MASGADSWLIGDAVLEGGVSSERTSARRQKLLAGLARAASLLALCSLSGCGLIVVEPQGAIGRGDAQIMLDSLAIMLAIVVPTIVVILGFAWWFRASNTKAVYLPDFEFSGQIESVTWSIPMLTIMLLGGVIWLGAHDLDPATPLPGPKPLEVQVVSLDWKWLFIYPEQGVASVNKLVIPVGRPVHFTLTSATVMTAFFVPELGSMIYTMNRMSTQLYLDADQPRVYLGLASHFSGDGFADMHFDVEAVTDDRFTAFVDGARGNGQRLDDDAYRTLNKPSENVAPFTYNDVEPGIFQKILNQTLPPGPGQLTMASPTEITMNYCVRAGK
jgi:cytochrome o ubiquinol oxidase subunit 2